MARIIGALAGLNYFLKRSAYDRNDFGNVNTVSIKFANSKVEPIDERKRSFTRLQQTKAMISCYDVAHLTANQRRTGKTPRKNTMETVSPRSPVVSHVVGLLGRKGWAGSAGL
jgi:hypothetical protein